MTGDRVCCREVMGVGLPVLGVAGNERPRSKSCIVGDDMLRNVEVALRQLSAIDQL